MRGNEEALDNYLDMLDREREELENRENDEYMNSLIEFVESIIC